ncbi:MAG: PAS domain-containing protein [Phycisphaerae bacterium]|nr:PAS domain-containing protein [Phycisphaerae bacterium]
MQAILEAAGDGILGFDQEGRFTFVNPAAVQMLGWPAEELIGKPGHATVHHSRSDGTPYPVEDCEVCTTIRDGVVRKELEGAYWRRNGTWFPVERTVTALRSGQRITGQGRSGDPGLGFAWSPAGGATDEWIEPLESMNWLHVLMDGRAIGR